jgi:hypothetical protein
MQIVAREFVDLALFIHGLGICRLGSLKLENKLRVIYTQHTVNPNKYFLGYETYAVDYKLIENDKINSKLLSKHENHKYLVDLDSRSIEFLGGPQSEKCQFNHGKTCICNLYISPAQLKGVRPDTEEEWGRIEREILNENIDWEYVDGEWTTNIKYEGISDGSE